MALPHKWLEAEPRIFFSIAPFQSNRQNLKIHMLEAKPVPQSETLKLVKFVTCKSRFYLQDKIFSLLEKKKTTVFVSYSNPTTNWIFICCLVEKQTCFQKVIPCFCSQFTAHPKISWSILPSSAASACSPIRLTSGRVKSLICCPRICIKTQYTHVCITTHINTHTFQHTKMIQN